MKLDAFRSRPNWNEVHNKEMLESLSKTEEYLCNRYVKTSLAAAVIIFSTFDLIGVKTLFF